MAKQLLLIDCGTEWPQRFREEGRRHGWNTVTIPQLSGWRAVTSNQPEFDAVVFDASDFSQSAIGTFLSEWRARHANTPIVNFTSHCPVERVRILARGGVIANLRKDLPSDSFGRLRIIIRTKRDFDTRGASNLTVGVRERISAVAVTDYSVLIVGKSGVGKELVAKDIHRLSSRNDKRMVSINCASIPADLVESELFGHKKGGFTGAFEDRLGAFRAAEGGTLFLDEIGEMPMLLQSKLLRAVEDKKIRPIGSDNEIDVDVRIVAATNQNLAERIECNQFRGDLYYRVNEYSIVVSPLRERLGDLNELLPKFIRETAIELKLDEAQLTLSQASIDTLNRAAWPGNVRELKSTIRSALMQLSQTGEAEIQFGHISPVNPLPVSFSFEINPLPYLQNVPLGQSIDSSLMLPFIVRAFIEWSGNASKAAKELRIKSTGNARGQISIAATDEIIRGLCRVGANVENLADAWGVSFSSLCNTIVASNRAMKRIKELELICQNTDGLALRFNSDKETVERVISRIMQLHEIGRKRR